MNHEEIINKVNEALEAKSLNFTAKMAETFAMLDGVYVPTGKFTPVRTDKTGKESIIGGTSFSKQYTPIQNADAFACLGEMADVADIEFVNVGSWGNGAGVYAQISLGEMGEIGAGADRVGKYLSLVNSHDGSRSLQLLVTPFRFWCSNQISKAIGDATKHNRIISIYHNRKGADRLLELAQAMHTAEAVFESTEEAYKRLADRRITLDEAREAMYRLFPVPVDTRTGTTERIRRTWENRVRGMIDRFNKADDGRLERLTGWNLYNAIQGTFQHDTKKTAMYEKSILLGTIASQSELSLNVVNDILFNGYNKTSDENFDKLFASVA